LKLDDVVYVSGQNPFLLSSLLNDPKQSVESYASTVKQEVMDVLKANLCGLVKETKTLES